MKRIFAASLVGTAVSLFAALAAAHVSVASGPGFADTTQEVTFGVGHGCNNTDTYTVKIEIPASVTSVRAVPTGFGPAVMEKNTAGLVTSVTWQKPLAELLASDSNYYKLPLRIKVPNAPFTNVLFLAHQTCRASDGTTTVVDWIAAEENPDGGGPEPAPSLQILPKRVAGWNKYTVPVAVADLSVFFSDALIVWKGSAAYSSNANTADLIGTTAGVTKLTALAANDEIWVKY